MDVRKKIEEVVDKLGLTTSSDWTFGPIDSTGGKKVVSIADLYAELGYDPLYVPWECKIFGWTEKKGLD